LDPLAQVLLSQVEPQLSLVSHIIVTSGVVDSMTRMSSTKSSSVMSSGEGASAAGGDMGVLLFCVV
jgi:hypothetical protein